MAGLGAPRTAQIAGVGAEQVQLVDALGLTQRAESVADRVARLDPVQILEEPGTACKHQVAVVLGFQQSERTPLTGLLATPMAHPELVA